MTDENTPRALSMEEGVLALRQSREAKVEAEAEPEVTEDQAEEAPQDEPDTETEEVTDQAPEDVEGEAEPDAEDDAETEEESDEDQLYEVEGETFTLKELQEWKRSGLRNADYTQKTQQLSEDRKSFEAERAEWESGRDTLSAELEQQKAQLQDALATFAIEQNPEPDPSKYPDWSEYSKAKSDWDKAQQKQQEARQAFQALQAEQHQEIVKREGALMMRHIPEWRDPEVFKSDGEAIVKMASDYGFSADEMTGITDHRMFRVLNDLRALKASEAGRKTSETAAAKKVTKAAKKLAPGSKPEAKTQTSKKLRQSRDQLKKSGSMTDAVAALRAQRAARG